MALRQHRHDGALGRRDAANDAGGVRPRSRVGHQLYRRMGGRDRRLARALERHTVDPDRPAATRPRQRAVARGSVGLESDGLLRSRQPVWARADLALQRRELGARSRGVFPAAALSGILRRGVGLGCRRRVGRRESGRRRLRRSLRRDNLDEGGAAGGDSDRHGAVAGWESDVPAFAGERALARHQRSHR